MNSSTDRIPIGRIGRPHGVRGEVTLVIDAAGPGSFSPGAVFFSDEGEPRLLTVRSARPYRDRGMIVAFEGFGDRRAAETLRGVVLTIGAEDRRDLEQGEYWVDDLIGLQAVDPSGAPLGEVADIAAGPQDRLVIATPDGRRVEVPFVEAIVGDPDGGKLPLDPPAGLFEES